MKACIETPLLLIAIAFAIFTSITLEGRRPPDSHSRLSIQPKASHGMHMDSGNVPEQPDSYRSPLRYSLSVNQQRLLELWGLTD